MISFNNSYATIFNPKTTEWGIKKANLGTSSANKDENGNVVSYTQSSWPNVSFYSKAAEKFDTLTDRTRIHITKGMIERIKGLDKDGNEKKDENGYPIYYLNVKVFDFEIVESKNGDGKAKPQPKKSVEEDEDNLPF